MALVSENVHVIEAAFAASEGTYSPVMASISIENHELTLALMCRGSDIERFTRYGESALFLACPKGEAWLDVVEFLCKNLPPGGADLPVGVRERGAVHWACWSTSLSIVRAVLGRPEVDVNRVDADGHTGPYYAIGKMSEVDFAELIRMLLCRGLKLSGDAVTIVADLVGAARPLYSVIELLFQNGLDPLAVVPGWGRQVWQMVDLPWNRQLHRLYRNYCATAVDAK
jgi:hypothetical protein